MILGVVLLELMLFRGFTLAIRAFALAFVVALVIDLVVVLLFGEIHLSLGLRTFGLILLFGLAVVAGVLGRLVGGTFSAITISIVAVFGGVAAGRADGGVGTIAVGVLLVVISKRALRADLRDRPIMSLAHRIATLRGTKFTGANVTRADFRRTRLAQTDMSHAVLAEATWDRGKGPLTLDDET